MYSGNYLQRDSTVGVIENSIHARPTCLPDQINSFLEAKYSVYSKSVNFQRIFSVEILYNLIQD